MATPEESAAAASAWQSPVPYLVAGLAAMVGLIAFALVILTCSYWRFSGTPDDVEEDGGAKAAPPVVEDKYLVIMAGHQKPTFLATPMCSTLNSLPFQINQYHQNIKTTTIQNGQPLGP